MASFEAFVTSGALADLIIGVLAIEAIGLALWRRLTGRGPAFLDLAGQLFSGACLVLALRFALTGGSAQAIALCLMASFAGHLFDLWRRGPWT